jgi:type I restriction enzyme M protein
MLDKETKYKIDDLRQILVGKVTDPRSQVEQITNALLYKFMNDMDEESVSMGGVPSYFVNEYEKYSWKNLIDKKTSGENRVNLYSTALEKMYLNENLPSVFRDIFKDSTLPYKDSKIFNKFISRIDDFKYSNSEKLGDAFEYLLSFMGSQGDAGQFRTPRHLINFIVEIINPKKNETILDPACGTAGFLISAYKYILNQNTKKELGDNLNSSERKLLSENLNGYDISPEFLKVSLMNMFLHKFNRPRIFEYDTLSSEEKWNEYYDVILANPPFFNPKGGIIPHNRFGIKSKKAEVLFVDYINEHLKPNGRAAIIVPEGIVEQIGNAYKQLREKLVKQSLIGVISLPAGVFQPYSNVKTSILFLDKAKNKKNDKIFFIGVSNDGYDLSKTRNSIKKNDLPLILDYFKNNKKNHLINFVEKSEILKNDKSLNHSKYVRHNQNIESNYDLVVLKDLTDIKRGTSITKKDITEGSIPVIAGGQKPAYFHNKFNRKSNCITISSSGAYAGFVNFHNQSIFASDCFTIETNSKKLNQKFLFYLIKSKQDFIYSFQSGMGQPHVYAKDFDDFKIPLPSLEVQNEIVKELDAYQKIINGCKEIIKYYKPIINIHPDWEMVPIENLCEINPKKSEIKLDNNLNVSFIPMEDVKENTLVTIPSKVKKLKEVTSSYTYFKTNDILLAKVTPCFENGKCTIVKDLVNDIGFGSSEFIVLRTHKLVRKEWIYCFIISNKFKNLGIQNFTGTSGLRRLPKDFVAKYQIPLPSIDTQDEYIKKIYDESEFVNKNKKMISNFEEKINNKINSIWSN